MSRVLIIRNIQRNKLRTFLTIVGIAIGVTAVIGLLSISMGLRKSIDEQVNKLGQRFVMVTPGGGMGVSVVLQTFGKREKDILTGISGVEHVAGRYVTSANLEFKDKTIGARIGGVRAEDLEYFIDQDFISLEQGTLYTTSNKVVLGKDLWKQLDKPGIGQTLTIAGEKFKISGVLGTVSMPGFGSLVFMPIEKAWEIAGVKEDTYSLFIVIVTQPEVSKRIEQKFDQIYEEGEYSVLTNEKLTEQANQLLGIVDGFLISITGVSLIVGILGVANTMFVSITERISQIGVMKTLGATNNRVAFMIIQESAVITFLGSIVGIISGLLLGSAIEFLASLYDITLVSFVPPEMMVIIVIGTVTLGVISGVLPAWEAAKMNPVEALKL